VGGLAILLIFAIYVVGALWLAYKVKRWPRKALVLVLAFLLPTADTFLGMTYVEHLCDRDGGLKVFRVVENVDGVLGLAPNKATLDRTGYRFIELDRRPAGDPSRSYRRVERLSSGEVAESFEASPKASYELVSEHRRVNLFLVQYGVLDDLVRDRVSGEVLARYRRIGGGAGLAVRFLGQFSDAGFAAAASCPPPNERVHMEALAILALKPVANEMEQGRK
jgi:hypothetical protein